jgi:TatD DNase family protein
MAKYIDIHTHNYEASDNQIKIHVIDDSSKVVDNYFCYGIHPWDIEKYNLDKILKELIGLKDNKNFVGIGETGLDKSINTNFNKQLIYFEKQIDFAIENEIKWLIVHCVKAYNEVYEILSRKKYKGFILFHGFNSSIKMVEQFKKFECFYSFGHLLLTSKKTKELFKNLHINQIFLETDDQTKYSIEDIYLEAANIKQIQLEELKDQLEEKFIKLFIE